MGIFKGNCSKWSSYNVVYKVYWAFKISVIIIALAWVKDQLKSQRTIYRDSYEPTILKIGLLLLEIMGGGQNQIGFTPECPQEPKQKNAGNFDVVVM